MALPSWFLTQSFLAMTVLAVPISAQTTPDRTGNSQEPMHPANGSIGPSGYPSGLQIAPFQPEVGVVSHRLSDVLERASQSEVARLAQQSASAGTAAVSAILPAQRHLRDGGIPRLGGSAHHDFAAANTASFEPSDRSVGQTGNRHDPNAHQDDVARPWAIGEHLPHGAYARSRWIGRDQAHGLPAPSLRLTWVRVAHDAFLVDRRSGEIIEMRHDLFD